MKNQIIRTSVHTALLLGAAALASAAFGSPTYSNPSSTPTDKTSTMSPSMNNGSVTSDTDLTRQVKSRLASMSTLQDANINVSTTAGKVTLTGTVTSKDQEKAAEDAAKAIPGVKKVDNDLSVSKPPKAGHGRLLAANEGGQRPSSTDDRITTRVESELQADHYMRRFGVKVATVRGVVSLTGDLPSQAAVNHAKAVALGVDGVRKVDTSGLNVTDDEPAQPPTR